MTALDQTWTQRLLDGAEEVQRQDRAILASNEPVTFAVRPLTSPPVAKHNQRASKAGQSL